jgi:hypothetical protein
MVESRGRQQSGLDRLFFDADYADIRYARSG